MKTQQITNPFALMMDPQAVLFAVEHSDRLQRLKRRVCRPLDKPMIPHALSEIEAFDQGIDEEVGQTVYGDTLAS
ncbi:hypothetical protein C7444_103117 [Sphaerotilus hippei]|uniref:Uncharacterized protein n=1 Tax=Sphaerotilus hippei TaxID=744406 RepID=A0A318H3A7_9BURK|nr:hypothetical protein [Sphaerotilus hippei]PXW98026.1 hypothetical protein C7444_103117 [Sphaerotilus hippei]